MVWAFTILFSGALMAVSPARFLRWLNWLTNAETFSTDSLGSPAEQLQWRAAGVVILIIAILMTVSVFGDLVSQSPRGGQ
jgi:hypothetical protein